MTRGVRIQERPPGASHSDGGTRHDRGPTGTVLCSWIRGRRRFRRMLHSSGTTGSTRATGVIDGLHSSCDPQGRHDTHGSRIGDGRRSPVGPEGIRFRQERSALRETAEDDVHCRGRSRCRFSCRHQVCRGRCSWRRRLPTSERSGRAQRYCVAARA